MTIFRVCASLVKCFFDRTDVTTVIHTHSTYSQMAANDGDRFIYSGYKECVDVDIPIIDDAPNLAAEFGKVSSFPSNAILVRKHGLFVWGSSINITFDL